jgi:hypothetical protein
MLSVSIGQQGDHSIRWGMLQGVGDITHRSPRVLRGPQQLATREKPACFLLPSVMHMQLTLDRTVSDSSARYLRTYRQVDPAHLGESY